MPNMMPEGLLVHNRPLPTLSLQEMSLVKIITTLCNHQKLRRLILRCNFDNERNSFKLSFRNGAEWKAVEAMANEMVSQICKPVLLKKRILEYLWPISNRIMVWKSAYASRIRNSFLQHFYWTERGRIDNTRTVRSLIENRNISVRKRFDLACSVCLQNEIAEIWREMSGRDKMYFYDGDVCFKDRISRLSVYWAHFMSEKEFASEDYDSEILINAALSYASKIGLLEAVKYFFTVAPDDQMKFIPTQCMEHLRRKVVSGRLLEEDHKDIACIVFSHMTAEDGGYFFYNSIETALYLSIHSDKYKLCLNLLEERLKSATVRDIAIALAIIFYTYHLEVDSDDECRLLFMDFWRKIPTRIKKDEELRDLRIEFLCVLIRDNFPFLLQKGAFQKIAEINSLDLKWNNSDKQVDFHRGKWDFLHFIIAEVITIPLMKMPKTRVLFFLKKRQSDFAVCNRMFRFVSKVQRKNPIQRE